MLKIKYLLVLLFGLTMACSTKKETSENEGKSDLVVGADEDQHGCKGSAGYQWSAVQKKCVRLFETGIELTPVRAQQGTVAYLLFASPDDDATAEVFLPGDRSSRLLTKKTGDDAGTWTFDTLTLTQWKGMYTLSGPGDADLYQGHLEVGAATVAPADAVPDVVTLLQGKWQSVDDPKAAFTVNGTSLTTYDKGQKRVTNTFAYVADCGGNACNGQKSKYGCFTTAGEFDIDCQSIVAISATNLEVTQGATGKTIRYRRSQ
ncbi:hypothetical protein [Fibrella forsythiae]|uniref:Lipoprotein n=1 Tax=Fibrella forsythiae TaxID=2817061 RepID=A0ABS3JDU5_9BACT|nr:hypothetical protein [Fibrella forsythiae]MBO0948180.1 hypothetical protein [Fibrella forsythiae]